MLKLELILNTKPLLNFWYQVCVGQHSRNIIH